MAGLAQARVDNAWLRLLGVGAVVAAAVQAMGDLAPVLWYVGAVAVLFIERGVFAKARAEGAPARIRGLVVWTALQSFYLNGLSIPLWFGGMPHGEMLAAVYLIAALVNAAATLRASTPLALAGAIPTMLYLLALPLADFMLGGMRQPGALTPLVSVLLFAAFAANLWKQLREADAAQLRAEAAALRERQAAAAAAAAKTDTIRRITNELRTPMAALIGAAEHLRRVAAAPEARAHIAALAQAGEVLGAVLDDISDLDRIENDRLQIQPKPCDPRELARGVVGAFRPAAQDKGLELFLDIAADAPASVEIDAVRVRQILFNLISNAIKFTSHGGVRVRLQAQPCDDPKRVRLGFVVADTGVGMSRSQLALLFSRERIAQEGGGPGLGLAICQRLARLMGGKLGARSELGAGSAFSFVLEAPLLAAAASGRSAA